MKPNNIVLCAALAALLGPAAACSGSKPAADEGAPVRFWHAFNAAETEALNRALETWQREQGVRVEPIKETFARGQTMLRRTLESGRDCPDLARIDATWLPGLVAENHLAPTPESVGQSRHFMAAAAALGTSGTARYGLPQAIDGLALIYRDNDVRDIPWPPATMEALLAGARTLTRPDRFGLSVRNDGYWFVAFLRALGGDLVNPDTGTLGIDSPAARRALRRFAELFGTVAPRPPPSGTAEREEARRFRNHTVAVVISGPWAVAEMTGGNVTGISVAALPGAPLGGQILVVPRCAHQPDKGWQLAEHLTSPAVQAEWARKLGVIPTSLDSLEQAGPFARQFYQALSSAEPLPRHPITAELFEDLSPAVSRVVAGDATANEALDGVARAWTKLLQKHGITPRPYQTAPPSTGTQDAP